MEYKHILITGGCGFVGSSLALRLRTAYPNTRLTACDNFSRAGSELNAKRLQTAGITVVTGDVRETKTFEQFTDADLIIDCAAEPSVMAGKNSSATYALETNIFGTVNCLELAKQTGARLLFLSTSRVYPLKELSAILLREGETRFEIEAAQTLPGISARGISEAFPLGTIRTLYGTTKLASEMIIAEYEHLYGVKTIVNRCGVIAGAWQFGKVDQGVAALWMARHIFENKNLSYIGFGGTGKQVRDFLHPDDLFAALQYQLEHFDACAGKTFTLGGGIGCSTSLQELTAICKEITGVSISLASEPETRWGDVPLYISDTTQFEALSGWKPQKSVKDIMQDIHDWMIANKELLEPLFS